MDEYYLDEEEDDFDLRYGDDLDALNDLENSHNQTSQKPLQPAPISPQKENEAPQPNNPPEPPKKRTIEELFTEFDQFHDDNHAKKYKLTDKKNDDLALIDYIIQMRKLAKESNLPAHAKTSFLPQINQKERDSRNYSLIPPSFPFIKMTTPEKETFYIRSHTESFEKGETLRIVAEITKNRSYHASNDLRTQANATKQPPLVTPSTGRVEKSLWVDAYKPKRYVELLSDESANRALLTWLRLWNHAVFGHPRRPPSLDESGCPAPKIALLAGPPGIGKTTLAHLVARHVGYNVVEVNASDDRSVDAFKAALRSGTEMRAVLGRDRRPNCMVFDEIDGAPAASIHFLVRYAKEAGKRLRRPIICICNDLYAGAMRALREFALVVRVPGVDERKLALRLAEVARREGLATDMAAMMALAAKSGRDARSALTTLQFFRAKRKVSLSDVQDARIGVKDDRSKFFDALKAVFGVRKGEMGAILETVYAFGDYELLANAIWDNYAAVLEYRKRKELGRLPSALDWLCFNDVLTAKIYAVQDYRLFGHLAYAFVAWHSAFGSRYPEVLSFLKFPDGNNQARKRRQKHFELLNQLISGLKPSIRIHLPRITLILDVLPFLKWIIVPNFRPINLNLHTNEEKANLDQIVTIMHDFNLTYIEESGPNGGFNFELDPNVYKEVSFGPVPEIAGTKKRMLAQQIQRQRIHNDANDGLIKENHYAMKKTTEKAAKGNKSARALEDYFHKLPSAKAGSSTENQLLESGTRFKQDIFFQYKEGYTNAVRRTLKIRQLK